MFLGEARPQDCVCTATSSVCATHGTHWHQAFAAWLRNLDEREYNLIRTCGAIHIAGDAETPETVPLWDLGFWNLLGAVLSYQAVVKIRDLGTFYHLIPENPNGAEWLIFWLRLLRTSESLKGLRGGMQTLTEALHDKIDPRARKLKRIHTNHKLVKIEPLKGGRARLTFEVGDTEPKALVHWNAKHVILTLPTGPLQELGRVNSQSFYREFRRDISAVFGFTLVKAFFAVKDRWWSTRISMANRFATRIPTRELHYWPSHLKASTKGLVMVYADRPAATFWSNLVGPGKMSLPREPIPNMRKDVLFWDEAQDKPSGGAPREHRRLAGQAMRFLKDNNVVRTIDEFDYVGIRDWGRPPHLGAAHAWYPERRVDQYLTRLSRFALGSYSHDKGQPPADAAYVYVCGEAYSDYQAFIEGSLRSVEHVLHRLLSTHDGGFRDTPTPWACPDSCNGHGSNHSARWMPRPKQPNNNQPSGRSGHNV